MSRRKIALAAILALAVGMVLPAGAGAAPLMDWTQPLQLDNGSAELSVEPELGSVSCPSATFCAATGTLGRLYTSTDPTDPESWAEVALLGAEIEDLECAGLTWCVAVVE